MTAHEPARPTTGNAHGGVAGRRTMTLAPGMPTDDEIARLVAMIHQVAEQAPAHDATLADDDESSLALMNYNHGTDGRFTQGSGLEGAAGGGHPGRQGAGMAAAHPAGEQLGGGAHISTAEGHAQARIRQAQQEHDAARAAHHEAEIAHRAASAEYNRIAGWDGQRAAREDAIKALQQEQIARAAQRNTKAYQAYKALQDQMPDLHAKEGEALSALQAHHDIMDRVVAEARARGVRDAQMMRDPAVKAVVTHERELMKVYVDASGARLKAQMKSDTLIKQMSGKRITEERINAHPLVANLQARINEAGARRQAAYNDLQARGNELSRAQQGLRRAGAELDVAHGGQGVTIHVSAQQGDLQRAWGQAFNREYKPGDLIALAGAKPGDEISLRVHDLGAHGLGIEVEMTGHVTNSFEVFHDRGAVVMHTNLVQMGDEGRNVGNAKDIIQGLRTMERMGIDKVTATAAGDGHVWGGGHRGYNGYYTWARLGFRGQIPGHVLASAQARFGPSVKRVEQIMTKVGGPQWWKANGSSWTATFTFSNRYCQKTLTRFEQALNRGNQGNQGNQGA